MFQSLFAATKIAVARAPRLNFSSYRGISNYSGLNFFGFSAPLKNPTQRSPLFNNLQSISFQTPLQLSPIHTSLRFFAAKKSAKSKSAKSGKPAAAKKQSVAQKQKGQKERERAKLLKEKEKAKNQAERQKAAAQKEKERERVQKEKEKEKQKREKEKEKQRLAKEKEKQNESKKKKKDENKPVRSRTAYTLFFAADYPKLKNQYPNKTLTEIVKVASQKWNNFSASEKKPFEDEANKDKIRYQKEMDAYKKTLPPKRPLSSYIIFSNDIRDAVKKENPESSISDLAKIIGEKWKSISNAEREKYNKQAEKAKADYKKKLEKHQASQ